MNPATLDAFRAHAVADYPREACGLVVVAKGRERYRPCRNLATTPSEHFVLAAEDYAAAEEAGEIVAVMHSHPDAPARASEGDRVACEASGLPWWIVSIAPDADGAPKAGELSCIEPSGYEAPLVGRPFHHGVLDCWTLCRDWYAREWRLVLPDPVRHDNWWDDGRSDLYTDNLAAAGFTPVDAKDISRGDLILMQIRSRNLVPNHAGIYLGDGLMLHHMYGRLSSRDVYGGYWVENTRLVARHAQAA
jgi:proteasome lid subunit RPN8/RPN11